MTLNDRRLASPIKLERTPAKKKPGCVFVDTMILSDRAHRMPDTPPDPAARQALLFLGTHSENPTRSHTLDATFTPENRLDPMETRVQRTEQSTPSPTPRPTPKVNTPTRIRVFALALAATLSPLTALAHAQGSNENPAYIADSPRARDSITKIPQLVAQDNLPEATRLVDEIMRTLGGQLVESKEFDSIYVKVRQRLHTLLHDSPSLLEHYRMIITPQAQSLLDDGEYIRVHREMWFTEPGLVASLRVAQMQIENARFFDARRTLVALLDHPDAEHHASNAAALATELSGYIKPLAFPQHMSITGLISQWARLANIEPVRSPVFHALPEVEKEHTSLQWNPQPFGLASPRLDSVLPRKMQQADLTPIIEINTTDPARVLQRSGAIQRTAPWTLPVAYGKNIYTNDGFTISCFDRFTLRLIWRHTHDPGDSTLESSTLTRARLGRLLEDSSTVTVDRGVVFASPGFARTGNTSNEGQIIALDASTGNKVWSKDLDMLDPTLVGTRARGAILVDGDTVIFEARKNIRQQRLVSMILVGLDRYSGELKWTQPIGSAGALPFQQSGTIAQSGLLANGIVYWSDSIGLLTAVETDTGNLLWVRRLESPELYTRKASPVWAATAPLMIGGKLFVLSPDNRVHMIDPLDGHLITSRIPQPAGQVQYIVAVGKYVACVGESAISFYPSDNFVTGEPLRTEPLVVNESNIRGRVLPIGNALAVPMESSVIMLNSQDLEASWSIPLDSTGNVLALDGQLIIVDDSHLHNYLSWETASQILTEQIEVHNDAHAAITLCELARNANQIDQILPPVDMAIQIAKSRPLDERTAIRSRLFDVLLAMVAPKDSNDRSVLDRTVVDQLLKRMGTLASSNEQLVAHRIALGSQHTVHGDYALAINAYQDILISDALRATMWEGNGLSVRAELEAAKRVGAALSESAPGFYTPYDELAAQELASLAGTVDPAPFDMLTRRFPWAIASAQARAIEARIHAEKKRHQDSVTAAQDGLRIINIRRPNAADEITNQLGVSVASGLVTMNRTSEAVAFVESFQTQYPEQTLIREGVEFTPEQILASAAGAPAPHPVIGPRFIRTPTPTLVAGSPITPTHRLDPQGLTFFLPQYNETRSLVAEPAGLRVRWSRVVESPEPPLVLWQSTESTIAVWSPLNATIPGTIESVDTATGRSRWINKNLRGSLQNTLDRQPDGIALIDGQFETPSDGAAPIDQILVVTDGLTIVLADRIGRAMGLDMDSGRVLWHATLPVNRLYDLDISGGTLGVCGSMVTDIQPGTVITQVAAAINARTGEPIQSLDQLGKAMPRWIRVSNGNTIVVSAGARILSMNLAQSGINWAYSTTDTTGTGNAAWVVDDLIFVLDDIYNKVFSMDATTGLVAAETVAWVPDRGWIDIESNHDQIVLAHAGGVTLVEHNGNIIGTDPLNTQRGFVGAGFAKDRTVLLKRANINADNKVSSTVTMIDSQTAKILDLIHLVIPSSIDRQPTSIEVADGLVVIGYGEVSIVLEAPPNDL